jgi:cytochrome b subunit of formate dehydrogenase
MKEIALHYIGGSFFVDILAVFPFELFINTGAMTKLFRLFRLPRLLKLVDVSRFNKLLKSFENKEFNDKVILKQYFILYIYHIFRLIILAVMITYFLGTISIFISNELNDEEAIENGLTV